MSYRDELDCVNSVYHNSCDDARLKKELDVLKKMLAGGCLTADNARNAEALYCRLYVKRGLLRLFSSFDKSKYDRLLSYITDAGEIAAEKGYKKTRAVMENARGLLNGVKEIAAAADGLENGLAEGDAGAFIKKLSRLKFDGKAFGNPFGDGVQFVDAKAAASGLAEDYIQKLERRRVYEVEPKVSRLFKEVSGKFLLCEYYPLPDEDGERAKTEILCTPFADECRLYAVHAAGVETLYELDASCFDGTTEEFIEESFIFVNGRIKSLLILNAHKLSGRRRKKLYSCALLAGGRGIKCFISDCNGGSEYALCKQIAADEKYSVGGLANVYLTMPPFKDTVDELTKIGIFCGGNDSGILANMPFTGFIGLNKIVAAYRSGGDWRSAGTGVSNQNERAAREYLDRITEQNKFIDGGWGAFPVGRAVLRDGAEFWSGIVPYGKAESVKTILSSGFGVFAKCGMVARLFSDFGGDLSRGEMEDAICAAVRIIYKLMRIPFVPEVAVLDVLDNPTAGALCAARGKRILFKYDCCRQFDWLRNAIVHESFHGLQNVLTAGGWDEWYFENLGITEGRIKSWADTDGIYDGDTGSDLYRVHIKEQDAYAFQGDCTRLGDEAWDKLFK